MLRFSLVGSIGLEPTTPTMSRWCSNQLSYEPEEDEIIWSTQSVGKYFYASASKIQVIFARSKNAQRTRGNCPKNTQKRTRFSLHFSSRFTSRYTRALPRATTPHLTPCA